MKKKEIKLIIDGEEWTANPTEEKKKRRETGTDRIVFNTGACVVWDYDKEHDCPMQMSYGGWWLSSEIQELVDFLAEQGFRA